MDLLDELRSLGQMARSTARDLRDFVATPFSHAGESASEGLHEAGHFGHTLHKYTRKIMKGLRGVGGIYALLGAEGVISDIFGKHAVHPDIGTYFGNERRQEEAERGEEHASRDFHRLHAVAGLAMLIPGAQVVAGIIHVSGMIGEKIVEYGKKLREEAMAESNLNDFIRNNALGDLSEPAWKRAEAAKEKYGTIENALESMKKMKELEAKGMEEIQNRDFEKGMRDLRAGGNPMWSNPMAIYTQAESARVAAKVYARTFMMRAGNRDDED